MLIGLQLHSFINWDIFQNVKVFQIAFSALLAPHSRQRADAEKWVWTHYCQNISVFPGAGKTGRSNMAGQEMKISAPRTEERWRFLSTQLPEEVRSGHQELGNWCLHLPWRWNQYVCMQSCWIKSTASLGKSIPPWQEKPCKHNHTFQYRADSPYLEMQASSTLKHYWASQRQPPKTKIIKHFHFLFKHCCYSSFTWQCIMRCRGRRRKIAQAQEGAPWPPREGRLVLWGPGSCGSACRGWRQGSGPTISTMLLGILVVLCFIPTADVTGNRTPLHFNPFPYFFLTLIIRG